MQTTSRRRVLSTVLALVLATESVSAVAVAASQTLERRGGVDAAVATVPASASPAPAASEPASLGAIAGAGVPDYRAPADRAAPDAPRPAAASEAVEQRAVREQKAPKVKKESKAEKAKAGEPKAGKSGPSRAAYRGRNHVWIPSMGINRSVYSFACSRSREPDNLVYRWGCSGANNVYLLGHAHSVFNGLHDAYVSGRLREGMKAWYADARGKVRTYAVRWWRVVRPTTSASWAWASLGRPSMTLQTCVGRNSQYRLIVRLVEVGG